MCWTGRPRDRMSAARDRYQCRHPGRKICCRTGIGCGRLVGLRDGYGAGVGVGQTGVIRDSELKCERSGSRADVGSGERGVDRGCAGQGGCAGQVDRGTRCLLPEIGINAVIRVGRFAAVECDGTAFGLVLVRPCSGRVRRLLLAPGWVGRFQSGHGFHVYHRFPLW